MGVTYRRAGRVVARILDMVGCDLLRVLVEDGEECFGEGHFGGHLELVGCLLACLLAADTNLFIS